MELKKMIGVRIAETRACKGMTQEKLAAKMGISSKYLSSIERGKENPTLDTLINLAQSLGIELAEMFTLIEVEDPALKKKTLAALLNEASSEQIKLALRILSMIIRQK